MAKAVLDEESLRTSKGFYVDDTGYAWIFFDGGHQLLHRYVMEVKLGRKLLPDEIVHHKDEDSLNNHPDNLELTSNAIHSAEHTRGQTRTPETKAKMRLSQLGRKHSDVTREKMRQSALKRERRK